MADASPPSGATVGELIGPHDGAPISVELYVRSLAPFGTRSTLERLVDRLDRLSKKGLIESLSIRVWGDSIQPDGFDALSGHGEDVIDRVQDLFAFAADSSCSIRRYFRIASDGSLVDADPRRRIVPPCRCLTVQRDGDLVAVFPCDVGTEHLTPTDAIGYLESADDVPQIVGQTGD